MVDQTDVRDVCCAALELSQTSWLLAFSPPGGGRVGTHKIKAGDVERLVGLLERQQAKAEQEASRSLTRCSATRLATMVSGWLGC
jgi:hypothetical protein